jgi:acetyl esterase/lipase
MIMTHLTAARRRFNGALTAALLVTAIAAPAVCSAASSASGSAPSTWTSEPAVAAKPVLDDRYPERRTAFPGGVVGLADLTYSSLAGYRPLRLDLYRPESTSTPHPLVIYVHGGGWQSGHTRHSGAFENWPGVLASIAARGYVVTSLEYRLSGEAPFPAAIQDVKSAIRWLRTHAAEYGIDKQRAVIWGGSAGGQLAALAGTSCGVAALEPPGAGAEQRPEPGAAAQPTAANGSASSGAATTTATAVTGATKAAAPAAAAAESDCIQGVIAWYGIFDFTTLASRAGNSGATNGGPSRYLGCALAKCSPAALAAAGATTYIDAKDPPVLMIHGVNDHTVPIQQSRGYLAALRAKGVKAELIEIPGVDHSFIGTTPEATRAASLRALDASLDFIARTLGPRHN